MTEPVINVSNASPDANAPAVPARSVHSGVRILGIDPGLRSTGFGVIEVGAGQRCDYLASGCIRGGESSGEPGTLPARLARLAAGVRALCTQWQPDWAAVEEVFVNVNPRSTLLLGQARGALLAVLGLLEVPVREYSALRVKQALVGHGHADKAQVVFMVRHLLGLREEDAALQADAADALACALTAARAVVAPDGIPSVSRTYTASASRRPASARAAWQAYVVRQQD